MDVSDRTPSVILVDDDAAIIRCIGKCLAEEADVRVLGYAHHAQAGVALALETQPDVVLLDIHMPGADTFWACREIVQRSRQRTKVLFYTGFPRDLYLDRCIEAGGSGMLSKHTETMADIGVAVRHVIRGHRYFSQELSQRFVAGETGQPRSRLSTLLAREVEVLRQLAYGKTNREIADEMELGLRSVEKVISDLKRKLDMPNTNALLLFAAREGLVFPELLPRYAAGGFQPGSTS